MGGEGTGFGMLLALVPFVVPLVAIGIAVTFALTFTSGARTPLSADPRVPVVLQAWLMPSDRNSFTGRWSEQYYGTVRLENGWFLWESGAGERWAVPVTEVQLAGVRGQMSLRGPGLDLAIRGRGWALTVSDRRINRFSNNTAKTFREARRAREFAGLLLRAGAVPVRAQ